MKTCPSCGELLGNPVEKCFKCGYVFEEQIQAARRSMPLNQVSAPKTSGKKVCPKCKKVYDGYFTRCEQCDIPLAMYTPSERKKEEKIPKSEKVLQQFGLSGLDEIDADSVRWVSGELTGNGLLEFSSLLSGAKSSELIMNSCLRALVEQNWILLRQLNKMNRQLEEMKEQLKEIKETK